jgi:hypothetical protein
MNRIEQEHAIERIEAELYDSGRLEGIDEKIAICNICPTLASVHLDDKFYCWTHFVKERDAMIAAHNPLED